MTRTFQQELELHISTWAAHCGAPKSVYIGHLNVLLDACRRETATRCAEIAGQVADSYGEFPSEHAVGAETVAVTIRREFGLGEARDAAGEREV